MNRLRWLGRWANVRLVPLMKSEAHEIVGVTVGKIASVGGGTSALVFGLTANEVAALAGIAIGVLGLVIQWHYNRRRDRRETAEHMARMAQWKPPG